MKITDVLRKYIVQSLEEIDIAGIIANSILLEHPADTTHGDYATNIALVLFGKMKKELGSEFSFKSPRDLAQALTDSLLKIISDENTELSKNINNVSVAGPGFINFTLSNAFLISKMGLAIQKGGDVIEKIGEGKKVMIEFTDPNPFKELHIGHLYSNIVGEAIAKSYEVQGADVQRACYQGDVGMHVSKSIWGMQSLFANQYPDLSLTEALKELGEKPLNEKVSFLGQSYAAGATAYNDDEEAKTVIQNFNYCVFISAQENLKDSTNFEPEVDYQKFVDGFSLDSQEYKDVAMLYVAGRKWSLDYFDSMYSRIGMGFDEFFFESLVGEFGYQIVGEYLKKDIFEESQGAIIFPGSKYGLHDRVFINSLGLPTYEAKELGLAPEKYRRYKYDKSIVITANEIDEYFKVLLKALEFTNPDLQAKTTHLSHGMVRLPEGKMSSRTGKVITAEWLMNEAHDQIKNHMIETKSEFSETEIEKISEIVGLGAIKFAFLKQSIGKDISFSFEDSLSFNGFSGPYLQYTYVRCHSVLAKAQNSVFSVLIAKDNNAESDVNSTVLNSNLVVSKGDRNDDMESDIAKYFDILLNNKEYFDHPLNMDEKEVLRNLYKYSDAVSTAASENAPHHVAGYLYDLAQSFNKFYGNNKVVTDSSVNENGEINRETQVRLLIVRAVSLTVKHGLHLLGIETVEKM